MKWKYCENPPPLFLLPPPLFLLPVHVDDDDDGAVEDVKLWRRHRGRLWCWWCSGGGRTRSSPRSPFTEAASTTDRLILVCILNCSCFQAVFIVGLFYSVKKDDDDDCPWINTQNRKIFSWNQNSKKMKKCKDEPPCRIVNLLNNLKNVKCCQSQSVEKNQNIGRY